MPEASAPAGEGLPGVIQPIEPGTSLGNYRLLFCVATGGMASVWVARQHGARGFAKLVALKMILPHLAAEEGFEQMFATEARLAALIRHPNVCEVFELVELRGTLALSMEWIDGDSLARLTSNRQAPLDARVAARIVSEAAAGLHAAHELRNDAGEMLNLVHRDVSTHNILISRDGHVKLADFGIAKVLNNPGELTAVGQIKGKVSFMSPEQSRGLPLDRRSDVFSLGVVLYVATVGKRPFPSHPEGVGSKMARLRACEFERPEQALPGFPPGLARIIERALRKSPAERYQTAAEMRRDLEQWLASSGPLITEGDVAECLHQRRGAEIEKREATIRLALNAPTRPALVSEPLGSGAAASTATAPPVASEARTERPTSHWQLARPGLARRILSSVRPRTLAALGLLCALPLAGAGVAAVLQSRGSQSVALVPSAAPTTIDARPAPPPAEAAVVLEPEPVRSAGSSLASEVDTRTTRAPAIASSSLARSPVKLARPRAQGAGASRARPKRFGPTERDL